MKHILTILFSLFLISCNQKERKTEITSSEKKIVTKARKSKIIDSVTTFKKYVLNNLEIKLTQTKSRGTYIHCKSKLVISRNNIKIDSLSFTPEAVGGYYGISKPIMIENHLIFTKHGNYDGRTILINEQGKFFNIIGGDNYYDKESKLLFTIYESDLSGFAVFDLNSDSTLIEMQDIEDRPISFHKEFGQRYFILSSNDETDENNKSVWEIEFDLNRIMQVDLDTTQINQYNLLKTWTLHDINCKCEK